MTELAQTEKQRTGDVARFAQVEAAPVKVTAVAAGAGDIVADLAADALERASRQAAEVGEGGGAEVATAVGVGIVLAVIVGVHVVGPTVGGGHVAALDAGVALCVAQVREAGQRRTSRQASNDVESTLHFSVLNDFYKNCNCATYVGQYSKLGLTLSKVA